MLQLIINHLNQLAQYVPWDAVLYAPVVSPILLLIKKLAKIHNGEVMLWLTGGVSVLAGVAVYLQQTDPSNPLIVGGYGLITMIVSQPFYKLLLKPAYNFIGSQITAEIAKAAQFNSDIKSAALPLTQTAAMATGTPSNPVVMSNGTITHPQDF